MTKGSKMKERWEVSEGVELRIPAGVNAQGKQVVEVYGPKADVSHLPEELRAAYARRGRIQQILPELPKAGQAEKEEAGQAEEPLVVEAPDASNSLLAISAQEPVKFERPDNRIIVGEPRAREES